MITFPRLGCAALLAFCSVTNALQLGAAEPGRVAIDLSKYRSDSGVAVKQEPQKIVVSWPISADERGEVTLNLDPGQPLIESMGIAAGNAGPAAVIGRKLDPVSVLTIGERDRAKAAQGMVFFDNPRQRPFASHPVLLTKRRVVVSSQGGRLALAIGDLQAGSFEGEFELVFFKNSPFISAAAVVKTGEEHRAILYDTGLAGDPAQWTRMAWLDPQGNLQSAKPAPGFDARPLAVKHRAIAAESPHGSLAVFPAPHQYFYPLDFAENLEFVWCGEGYRKITGSFGFGIRQPIEGDKRFVPWIDAPRGTEQRLNVFYLLSRGPGASALEKVADYTRGDRFKKLPGYRTFTSHYHIEHTADYVKRQKEQKTAGIPKGLEVPGFITKFKATGVDIVHLAEFHFGSTPGQKTAERLAMQKVMHAECERLSDSEILVLPGEEPNVHLGGHWISLFPKPVYWVLHRGAEEPFAEEMEGYGTVYHVANTQDVLKLMERENGLMWTAHARIKSSLGFPDRYKTTDFYQSEHFLGAAWKAMPSDLSRLTLGWRILDLLDDMNRWGQRKQVIGEVDVFRVEPDYELYAHMNINYVKLAELPKYRDGWRPVLDTLRGGHFFVTTGEIVIPEFAVDGQESGNTLRLAANGQAVMEAKLEWTFPLAFAEAISSDGKEVDRQRIDLSDTESFGSRTLRIPLELKGRDWVRLEVWDIAANGAFTQPVWMDKP